MKRYRVNEVFYSLQGEGVRAGTANVFVRFSKCNLKCSRDGEAGFDCDTEFESGANMTLAEIEAEVRAAGGACQWLVLTGGEPALQVDNEFCDHFHDRGYKLAIETNGTIELPDVLGGGGRSAAEMLAKDGLGVALSRYCLDWICVSPKSAEHTIRQPVAHEVKYVRNAGQGLPSPSCESLHQVLSPAFASLTAAGEPVIDRAALAHCIRLCQENPRWRLSMQLHKLWKVR